MLRKLDRILLRVPSIESAVTYYRDVMGLRVIRQDARVANLALPDGGELVLHADSDLPDEATYLLVDDVREMYQQRGKLKLTFAAPPAQVARGYVATVKDPFGNVLNLLDRSVEGSAASEDAQPVGASLFPGVEQRVPTRRDLLTQVYEKVGRTADDLPYTPHFEKLYDEYVAAQPEPKPTRAEVWRHLLNLRKAAKLPKLGEARSQAPEVSSQQREALRAMLGSDIGRRDRLPYTERFDKIVDEFNAALPRKLSPHLVWRLLATLAK